MELTQEHIITVSNLKELPPLLEQHTDFTVWVLDKVRKFHKDLRFNFGTDLANTCLMVMDGLVESLYIGKGRVRADKLQEVSICLEQLRIHLRMAWKLRLINASALHYATGCLQKEGKMLGGWIKSETNSRKTEKYES